MTKYFTIEEMINEIDIEIVNLASDYRSCKVKTGETNRPGLQLAGYYPRFEPSRIQIIGNAEWQFINDKTGRERRLSINQFLKKDIPAVVFTSNNYVFDEFKDLSKRHDRTLLKTKDKTGKFINDFYNFAIKKLSASTTIHGGFMDIYGLGVLITGKSGVGKSETALDLIMRGHKLISDDIVNLRKINGFIEGSSPEITKNFMEIRGIGILNIRRLFGTTSVMESSQVDAVIHLEEWDSSKEYDRLGFEENHREILGVNIPSITIPMKPGRNTAMIVEVAIRNLSEKNMGFNSAEELNNRLLRKINRRKKNAKEY